MKTTSSKIFSLVIGHSVKGKPILAYSNFQIQSKKGKIDVLIIGGIHGDERAPVFFLENFSKSKIFLESPKKVVIIPMANPDGFAINSRLNSNGVDLNRNFPYKWSSKSESPSGTKALSEPEAFTLNEFILKWEPKVIISMHWALAEIDPDGPQSNPLAQLMYSSLTKTEKKFYLLKNSGPRSTSTALPGSLGQYCGFSLEYAREKKPVMITLELPYTSKTSPPLHPLPEGSFERACTFWKMKAGNYRKKIEPGVFKMLECAIK